MNIRAIKTAQTESAVERIKIMTKKEVKKVNYKIPQIFSEKKQYMQSDAFLKDPHNEKMLELGDEIFECRYQIGEEITKMNKFTNNKFVQAINGFTRLKKEIDKNNMLHFEETPSINNRLENKYRVLRNIELFAESQKALI